MADRTFPCVPLTMHRTDLPLRAASITVLAAALVVVPAPAHAARMIPIPPYRAKDFTVTRTNGIYHLFYILHDTTLAFAQTEKSFGHAVSADLRQWTQLQPVLPVRAGMWDNAQVWAPSLAPGSGPWWMLYTGVTEGGGAAAFQRIGVAQSSDLVNWTRTSVPVFSCLQTSWTWCDSTQAAGGNLRDPFVMADPAHAGGWLMYYVALRDTVSWQMLVGVAASAGDVTVWSDLGPLLNTDFPRTGSRVIESPHVFQHGALWYLFYTTGATHPIAFQTSSDPLAAPAAWSAQRWLVSEVPGTDHLFASEHLRDGTHDYFLAANDSTNGVDIWEMVWDTPPHFHFIEPGSAQGVGVGRGAERDLGLAPLGPAVSAAPMLRVVLPGPAAARLELFDLAGRRVRRLLDRVLPGGACAVQWDGRDDRGVVQATGVFLARLTTAAGVRTTRVTLAH
jgi:glycosyl hydrolase family 32